MWQFDKISQVLWSKLDFIHLLIIVVVGLSLNYIKLVMKCRKSLHKFSISIHFEFCCELEMRAKQHSKLFSLNSISIIISIKAITEWKIHIRLHIQITFTCSFQSSSRLDDTHTKWQSRRISITKAYETTLHSTTIDIDLPSNFLCWTKNTKRNISDGLLLSSIHFSWVSILLLFLPSIPLWYCLSIKLKLNERKKIDVELN